MYGQVGLPSISGVWLGGGGGLKTFRVSFRVLGAWSLVSERQV